MSKTEDFIRKSTFFGEYPHSAIPKSMFDLAAQYQKVIDELKNFHWGRAQVHAQCAAELAGLRAAISASAIDAAIECMEVFLHRHLAYPYPEKVPEFKGHIAKFQTLRGLIK